MKRNLKTEALMDDYNMISIGALMILFFASGFNFLFLAIALFFELTWILFVPDTFWFKKRIEDKYAEEDAAESEAKKEEWRKYATFELDDSLKKRVYSIERLSEQIQEIAADKEGESAHAYQAVADKADMLVDQFLKLALQNVRYHQYIEGIAQEAKIKIKPATEDDEDESIWAKGAVDLIVAHYQKQVEKIKHVLSNQTDSSSLMARTIGKQIEVIATRIDYIAKMGIELVNLNHNLILIEATLGLLSDQVHSGMPVADSISTIDDTLAQASAMTRSLEEIAPYQTINA